MQIRLSAHGAYRHQYHIVWIPKYRKKILQGQLKVFLSERLGDIHTHYPDIEIEQCNIQVDHVHLVICIPPRYAVSEIIGKIKTNTSREIRKQFPGVRKIYRRDVFWSPGFFSSTVGIDEDVIRRYVEFQEKMDKGQVQLSLDFQVPRA